jgi:hypothetical protein
MMGFLRSLGAQLGSFAHSWAETIDFSVRSGVKSFLIVPTPCALGQLLKWLEVSIGRFPDMSAMDVWIDLSNS